ncbi:MAG: hypothetical protein ACRD3R_05330, partial [Terriglobales bacterium]
MRHLFAIAVLGAALTTPLAAQIRGIPPSVTSIGSGSTPMTPGIGASVTSLGPAGLVDHVGSLTSVPGTQPPAVRPVHNVIPFFWPAIYQPQPQPLVVVVQSPPPVVVVVERDEDDDRDRREPLVLEWKGDKYIRVSPEGENGKDEENDKDARSARPDRRRTASRARTAARRPEEP